MKLQDDVILIRNLKITDLDDYYDYAKSEKVGPMAGWKPVPDYDTARRVLSGMIMQDNVYAIVLKEEKKMIGTLSIYNYGIRKYKFVKQLGFSLSDKYWNHGYMTRVVKMAIDYIFNKTDCEVIEVGHHSDNYQSKRVIEKCGFNYDGRLCKYKKLYDGRVVDADWYSLTIEDYKGRTRL